ncbi:hypothetical protein MRX96_015400 [Rhipicephalus microplus]
MVRVRPAATRLEMRASLQPRLFVLLLEASLLLGAEARKPVDDASFHEAVFHYANQKCDLGLEKSSNKHVILVLPEGRGSMPFRGFYLRSSLCPRILTGRGSQF